MNQSTDYRSLLDTSRRVNWRVDDVLPAQQRLDFDRPFLPETFARTAALPFLTPSEKLTLNQIRAHGYLAMFELVEQFILPFVSDHLRTPASDDSFRQPALLQFASEETKHMELFGRFRRVFRLGFPIDCGFIGPADQIRDAVLAHSPLSIAIAISGIEWMSQGHYVGSVKDDTHLDTLFSSLLKFHWIEECQHAQLDALVLRELASQATPAERDAAIDEYFEIGAYLDAGLGALAALDLESFERASGRRLGSAQRAQFVAVQHQALRWTFLGSAMGNRNFLAGLRAFGTSAAARVEAAAMNFS